MGLFGFPLGGVGMVFGMVGMEFLSDFRSFSPFLEGCF